MDIVSKLDLLSQDAQYDLACSCGTTGGKDHRTRGKDGHWLYPVTVPRGGSGIMLKTLLTNMCTSDCAYCPLRSDGVSTRVSIAPYELASFFIDLVRKRNLIGIFLSSGILDNPDRSMQLLTDTAEILRRRFSYRGYIHLKIIPGASDAAIHKALSLASAVSLNIETPGARYFRKLSSCKDYDEHIIRPLRMISDLTSRGQRYSRITTTTQFIVGASNETDRDLLSYMWGLYDRLSFSRIYFSGYQRGLGRPTIPGERDTDGTYDVLTREHRLYQSDFLMRTYGFRLEDFILHEDGNLDSCQDPKLMWAQAHKEFYPVSLNRASRLDLLKVPGLGPTLVDRILSSRREGSIRSLDQIKIPHHLLQKAQPYLER